MGGEDGEGEGWWWWWGWEHKYGNRTVNSKAMANVT